MPQVAWVLRMVSMNGRCSADSNSSRSRAIGPLSQALLALAVLGHPACSPPARIARPTPAVEPQPAPWTPDEIKTVQTALERADTSLTTATQTDTFLHVVHAQDQLRNVTKLTIGREPLPRDLQSEVERTQARIAETQVELQRRALSQGDLPIPTVTGTIPTLEPAVPPTSPRPRPPSRLQDVRLSWPVDEVHITSPFGHRVGVLADELADVKYHDGVDLRGKRGAPLRPCGPGIVSFADARGGYGLIVSVDHGLGVSTHYAHLDRIAVRAGQTVTEDDIIGHIGSTGRSTAPHLHLMLTYNGRKSDPVDVLGLNLGEIVHRLSVDGNREPNQRR